MTLLRAEGLTRILPGPPPVTLVQAADVTVERGQFVAIVGPSGCGKSSLLYLLGLLDRPTRGGLWLDGIDIEQLGETDRTRLRLERIGFVFQFHFLLPELTARGNVALPLRRAGFGRREAEQRAEDLLAKLDIRDGGKRPDQMSGGQRQRVAIARALANDPALILGDEPTGNLDSVNSARVVAEFQRLAHEESRAVVCVTHDLEIAAAADRRIHMLDGRIERED